MTHRNISPEQPRNLHSYGSDPDTAAIDSRIDEAVYELEHQPDVEPREPGVWRWVLLAAMAWLIALAIWA